MATPNFFYRDARNREIGPMPLAALARLRETGMLTDETPIRAAEATECLPCRTLISVAPHNSPTSAVSSRPEPAGERSAGRFTLLFAIAAVLAGVAFFSKQGPPQKAVAAQSSLPLPSLSVPPSAPVQVERAVMNNLRQLAAAADQFYLENAATQAGYDQLVGADKYLRSVLPVAGEDYRRVVFKQGVPLTVYTSDGRKFTLQW